MFWFSFHRESSSLSVVKPSLHAPYVSVECAPRTLKFVSRSATVSFQVDTLTFLPFSDAGATSFSFFRIEWLQQDVSAFCHNGGKKRTSPNRGIGPLRCSSAAIAWVRHFDHKHCLYRKNTKCYYFETSHCFRPGLNLAHSPGQPCISGLLQKEMCGNSFFPLWHSRKNS